MIFLLAIFLLLSQFQCVFSNEKHIENVELFNEFINAIFDMKPTASHSKQKAKMTTLNVADAAEILVLLEENVAKNLVNHGIMLQIDNDFSHLYAMSHNEAMRNKLEEKLTTHEDKAQFLMLLLSFATRLAFTIGSEALEKHGFNCLNIQMNSFVLAYKHLETAFPVDENLKEIEYKFRYYQEIMEMSSDHKAISFEFTAVDESQQKQRKKNFDTLHFYLAEWKAERVLHLFEELQEFSKTREGDQHFLHRDKYSRFLDHLMRNWNGPLETDGTKVNDFYHFNPLSLFVLKNFAANLVKRMLREKQRAKEAALYFEQYPHMEIELSRILAELNGYLEENHKKISEKEHDNLINNELLMHYENAIKINWSTKEELISLNAKTIPKIQRWIETLEKCAYGDRKMIHRDVNKIMKEIENNRKAFESLYMDQNNVLPLFEELENFKNSEDPDLEEQIHKRVWKIRKENVKNKMKELIEKVPLGIEEFEKYSREEHIVNILSNQLIKSALDIPENEYKKTKISVEKCAKLLEFVEKNVAHKIDENVEILTMDHILSEIFGEFKNFEQHAVIGNMEQKLNKRFKQEENKVLFLMLLLSFATRLGFTIGSEALEKHGFNIQMNLFVHAYKHLEEKNRVNHKFRYYYAAILHMDDEEKEAGNTAVLFDFTTFNKGIQERRMENFETLHDLMKKSKEQTVGYLLRCINMVLAYDGMRPYFVDYPGVFENFLHLLEKFKNKDGLADHELKGKYKKELFVGMKNFALNLGKRILHMKEHNEAGKRFFQKDAKQNAVHAFEKNLEKHRNDAYEYDKPYLYENEILMHYEDAIPIDWRTKEDIDKQAAKMREFHTNWEKIIQKCSSLILVINNCKLEEMEKEMEKEKELFESFYLQESFNEILAELKKCAAHKMGKNKYTGKEVKQLVSNWKKEDDGLNLLLNLKKKMEKEIEEMMSAV